MKKLAPIVAVIAILLTLIVVGFYLNRPICEKPPQPKAIKIK
jgi:hypothetical protein